MDRSPIVMLIGLRGSGKTTLGRALADACGRAFIDLDDRTAQALGHDTPGAAIRSEGIDAFRAAESSELERVLGEPGIVLALGGGTPTAPGATDRIRASRTEGRAVVMYLRASPDDLAARLSAPGAPDRPALIGEDAASDVRMLFEQRDALYRELADGVLHVGSVAESSALAALRAWAPV
ncbi:MAG: shikimate kinase [Planctomycetota bacterium]